MPYVLESEDSGVFNKVGKWVIDTFGPEGNLRGSSIGGVMQGMADPVVGAIQTVANAVGLGDQVNPAITSKNREYEAARSAAGREGIDVSRMVGNMASPANVGVGKAVSSMGGVSAALKGALGGAVGGAMSPISNEEDQQNFWSSKAKETGAGGLVGAAVPLLGSAVGRIVSPRASTNPDVQKLLDAEIRLTPGQALGGVMNRVENKARAFFGLGDSITAAQRRGEADINRAVLNAGAELVSPVSGTSPRVSEIGHSGLRELDSNIKTAYNRLVPNLTADLNDPQFYQNIQSVRNFVTHLPPKEARMFDSIINREIGNRMNNNGMLVASDLQDAMADIRNYHESLSMSNNRWEQDLAKAFGNVYSEMKDLVRRTNPRYANQLDEIDAAQRVLDIAKSSGSYAGNTGGTFSPSQLHSAVKSADKTGQFGVGRAFLQDLSDSAKKVMSSKYDDSSTAGRLAMSAGAVASGLAHPGIPLSMLAMSGAYIPAIQRQIVNAIARRPEGAVRLSDLIRESSILGAPGIGGIVAEQ